MRAVQRVNGVIKELERYGFIVDVTERRLPYTHITKDLFGVSDLIAVNEYSTLLVQVTTHNLVSKHMREYQRNVVITKFIKTWLADHHRAFVMAGWAKVKFGWELRMQTVDVVVSSSGTPILQLSPCEFS